MQQRSRQLGSLPVALAAQRTAGKHSLGGSLGTEGTCLHTAQGGRVGFAARPIWLKATLRPQLCLPPHPQGPIAPQTCQLLLPDPAPAPRGLLHVLSAPRVSPAWPSLRSVDALPPRHLLSPAWGPPSRPAAPRPWGPGEPAVEAFTGKTVIYHLIGVLINMEPIKVHIEVIYSKSHFPPSC